MIHTSTKGAAEFVPSGDGAVSWLRQDQDVRAGTCIYMLSESGDPHEIDVAGSETVLVLEGRLRFEITDGPTLELGPGESVSFERGTVGSWSLVEDTKLFFVAT